MADVSTLPGGGVNVTVIEEAVEAAVDEWMELAPAGLFEHFYTIEQEYGESGARAEAQEIISSALMEYHAALHKLEQGQAGG